MLSADAPIGLASILTAYRARIVATWLIVLVENVLIALVPLLIGFAIDGLLAGRSVEIAGLGGVLVMLAMVAVARRIYDTRIYGTIRVGLGIALYRKHRALQVSKSSARLDMSRELVDFIEHQVPQLITAVIQIVISLVVLTYFDGQLGIAAVAVVIAMVAVYACFHRRFYRVNATLNEQRERQVDVIGNRRCLGVFRHLRALRQGEVALSDTEAMVYGAIFVLQIAFIVHNLYGAAQLPEITAGTIFSIATYSWEYVEAALLLPIALQDWSRLSEITSRLNRA